VAKIKNHNWLSN